MAHDHPFQHLFETLGRVPISHAESVNRQAYEILSDILTVPVEKAGRCILLRAPRAGHGKTHLLSRIQHQFGASYEFIPLHSAFGCRIDASSVTDDTLRRLVRQLPASGGLTVLDLVTRRLFATALQPLVSSGEVPCQDREGALTALRARPIETFDFHHPNAVTAHWARENFEVLGQRLSLELAQRSGLPVSEVAFWVDVLFRFSAAPLENSSRVGILAESVHAGTGLEMARLEALLGMLTLVMRVVLVADDLEGFSADETAALRLAAFLGSLRQSVERLDVILSLNQDIWQSAFVPRLSGGLADRLSEVVVELEPLKEAEMAALLDSRVPGLGSRVLERLDVSSTGTHARGLIRAAGLAWLKATAMDSAPAPVVSPVALQAPLVEAVIPPPLVIPSPFHAVAPEPAPVINEVATVLEITPEVEIPAPIAPPPVMEKPAEISPEPQPEVLPQAVLDQPVIDSPFQLEPTEPLVVIPAPPVWHEPAPAYIPPISEAPPAVEWNPPAAVVEAPLYQSPVIGSPFQVDPAPTFAPPVWQEQQPVAVPYTPEPAPVIPWSPPSPPPDPAPFYPPAESPFQAAPPEPFAPAAWQEPAPLEPPPIQSPFQAAPPEVPTPDPVTPPPTPAETDRVDDLLRQFRERYGRGSL